MPSAHNDFTMTGPSFLNRAWLGGADARFCELTGAADKAFENQDDATASRFLAAALAEAERLFDAARLGSSPFLAPMAYTIACHNAAEARKKGGDRISARGLRRRAVEKLVETAECPTDPLALRVNCIRHLRHALVFLAGDLADNDTDEEAEFGRLVARYRAIREQLTRVTAHLTSELNRSVTGEALSPRTGKLN